MTRVDFYILAEQSRDNRFTLACRLTEKAWSQGNRIAIYTGSEDLNRHMDRLLWTFREHSFIPHGITNKVDDELNPVLILESEDPKNEHQVLINLSENIPPFFSRFERVAECVDADKKAKEVSREHYRFYKDQGYQIATHNM